MTQLARLLAYAIRFAKQSFHINAAHARGDCKLFLHCFCGFHRGPVALKHRTSTERQRDEKNQHDSHQALSPLAQGAQIQALPIRLSGRFANSSGAKLAVMHQQCSGSVKPWDFAASMPQALS
jgi:hypothetical protein